MALADSADEIGGTSDLGVPQAGDAGIHVAALESSATRLVTEGTLTPESASEATRELLPMMSQFEQNDLPFLGRGSDVYGALILKSAGWSEEEVLQWGDRRWRQAAEIKQRRSARAGESRERHERQQRRMHELESESETKLRELACPDDPANGDHKAQLQLGIRFAQRGDDQGSKYWLRWAAVAGYHVDNPSPYES